MNDPEHRLANVLAALLNAFRSTIRVWSIGVSSPARKDMQSTLAKRGGEPVGSVPVATFESIVIATGTATADHVHGIVVSLRDDVGFAPMILARSALESGGIASWMLEPGLDLHGRLRRSYAVRVDGLRERCRHARQLAGTGDPRVGDALPQAEARLQQVLNEAHALRIPVHRRDGVVEGLKTGVPSSSELAEVVLKPFGLPHVELLRGLWSSATHTSYVATTLSLRPVGPRAPGADSTLALFQVPSFHRILAAACAGLGLLRAGDLLVNHFGLDPGPLQRVVNEHLGHLRDAVIGGLNDDSVAKP